MFFITATCVFADKITFRSGAVLRGKVTKETDGKVIIQMKNGSMSIDKDRIKKIVPEKKEPKKTNGTAETSKAVIFPSALMGVFDYSVKRNDRDPNNTEITVVDPEEETSETMDMPELPLEEIKNILTRISTDDPENTTGEKITQKELRELRGRLYQMPKKELGTYFLESFPNTNERINTEVLLYFQETEFKESVSVLMKNYIGLSEETRMAVLPVIGMLGQGDDVFGFIRTVYEKASESEKKRIIPLLKNFQDKGVVDILVKALDNKNWWTRSKAEEALWEMIRTDMHKDVISEKLIGSLSTVRTDKDTPQNQKIILLSRIDSRDAATALYRLVMRSRGKCMEFGAKCLAKMKTPLARRKLHQMLFTRNKRFVKPGLAAIQSNPKKTDILPLINCLDSRHADVRRQCEIILKKVTKTNFGSNQSAWLTWYEQQKE